MVYADIMNEYTEWYGFRANSNNLPEHRPGVYTIRHIETGKVYVGASYNVHKRLQSHANGSDRLRLQRDIDRYGKSAFEVVPIYYSLDGTFAMLIAEADAIENYDAINHGYNYMTSSGDETFPERHRQALRDFAAKNPEYHRKRALELWQTETFREARAAAFARPEVQRLRAIAFAKPEFLDRISESSLDRWADPNYHSKTSAAIRKAWSDPELRQEHSERIRDALAKPEAKENQKRAAKEVNSRPEVKAKLSNAISNLIWITDGNRNRRIPKYDAIPEGWRRGKFVPPR